MRALFILLSAWLAGPALAECPGPGKPVKKVNYADGMVGEILDGSDELLRVSFRSADGTVAGFSALYGLYYDQMTGEVELDWDWGQSRLVPVLELPVGQEVTFDASATRLKDGLVLQMKVGFTSRGDETLAVDGCDVPVIRFDQRQMAVDGSGGMVSQVWFDPESLLVLKSERDRIDGAGAVIDHKSTMAVGFEM